MNNRHRIVLRMEPDQAQRLEALQKAFAQVCNALAPMVQQTGIWSRVALHHMAYRRLREQFPAVGSQMVCNAIYAVSRTARVVFQDPASPFQLQKIQGRKLPLLRFLDSCPVYFDRHTLSLVGEEISMYTLDGRMRFRINAPELLQAGFHARKLAEVTLMRGPGGRFELVFLFGQEGAEQTPEPAPRHRHGPVPQYVQVEELA